MVTDWSDLPIWLLTSFAGAAIVKLLDLIASRYVERRGINREKAQTILAHIGEFGELTQLYRFHAYLSVGLVKGEDGEFRKDEAGTLLLEKKILEPEPRFEEAIKALKGTDLNSAISQRIASIRLSSSEAIDLALELDPTGGLRDRLNELYAKTVFGIDLVLRNKEAGDWRKAFERMLDALKEADEARRSARAALQRYFR